MYRLKVREVPTIRAAQSKEQGARCAICGDLMTTDSEVLDHDHGSGELRGVLHRGCNAMLGRIENNAPRDGLRGLRLAKFLKGVYQYLHNPPMQGHELLHPTFKSEEEKRERRNRKAREARARRKQQ